MKFHEIDHLADHAVLPGLDGAVTRNCSTSAEMLAYIAVADVRRLYLPAGYPSMVRYCVGKLNMSEATALRRIDVARGARKFPAIFDALADGRLNQTGVLLLAPYVTRENWGELLAAAVRKSKSEIELFLAGRFPRADVATRVQACRGAETGLLLATGTDETTAGTACESRIQLALERVGMTSPEQAEAPPEPRAKITPLSPQRFALQFTVGQEAHDLLVEARALLGHAVPSGDVAEVFLRAMRVYVAKLKKQRFAATSHPRKSRGSRNARHIPAEVKRAVLARDGERCTFVSEEGHRCEERTSLEFDHVIPIARGGAATPDNLRVLCRPHNQHAADRVLGKGFMDAKRDEVKRQAAELRAQRAAAALAKAQAKAAEDAELEAASDVIPGLENLGCTRDQLRAAAARLATIPNAPLGERMRFALKGLCPGGVTRIPHVARAQA